MTEDDDRSDENSQREWRFDVDDVGDAARTTLEPQAVDLLNALFFVLGIGATLALIVSVVL